MSRSSDAHALAPGQPARRAALDILSQVLRRKRPLDHAAAEVFAAPTLAPRDAAFTRAIVGASLRRLGQLQALIGTLVPKAPLPHKAGPTLEILIAGAAELLFLDVAPHAAVDAANRLAQADEKAVHFRPLINAVLRRVAQEGAAIIARQDAAALNTPDWLWQRWVSNYGEKDARAIAAAHLTVPPLDITLRFPAGSLPERPDAEHLARGRIRLKDAGRIEALPGFDEGRWWVQDFAASLPATLLRDVAGKRVIDLCAAPGGKTLQLASSGARVTAVDIAAERLALIRANLERVKVSAELVQADARDWHGAESAPFVLLDAPCLATGTIRRHPDLPWIKSRADLTIAESLQSELFDAAAALTAPGGTLVYAVCSLEPEEGVEQVDSFLRRRMDFTRVPVGAEEVLDAVFVTSKGDLQTLPSFWADRGGMDGFYAARLRRADQARIDRLLRFELGPTEHQRVARR
jgi:16S rRNA (cytosine967-C5)-methyltransferase